MTPSSQPAQTLVTRRLATATLVFLLAVILWGSFVRASGSGAGCGNHWPLCNGMVVPDSTSWKTLVEFTHRVTSGVSLILCALICYFSFKESQKGAFIRRAGLGSLILILTEALIGAALVLLKLVEQDQSALRAASMCVHLMNTFLLLGAVTLTLYASGRVNPQVARGPKTRAIKRAGGAAILLLLVLGASGAATALGDTLFPVQSLAQGLAQDLSPARHFLIALRIYHPIIALCVSFYLVLFARWVIRHFKNQPRVLFHATGLLVLQCLQLLLGVLNVLFLAPVAIQMAHLLCSDLIWINLVLLLAGLLISEGSQNAV